GYAPCGTDATAFYRWQEQPRLLVTKADGPADPDQPPGVPDGDLAFGPEHTAPEQDQPWPVLLGRVSRATGAGQFTVDGSARRYAGAVAAPVVHPEGVARIDLGPAQPGDPAHFAVRVPPDSRPDQGLLLDITDDATTLHDGLVVHGELRIEAGALEFPVPEGTT